MSTESPAILVVDDDADIVKAARLLLERHGYRVAGAADPDAAWVALAGDAFDAILLDLNFARGRTSGEEGFALLERLLAADRDAVVVVVTGHSGINVAVRAMRDGASDFVIKPWSNERLLATVERAVALRRARREAQPAQPADDRMLLGESGAIRAIRDTIARVAPTDAGVLIRGGPGSGKSLAARMIHHGSARVAAPLVVLDPGMDWRDPVAQAQEATLLIEDIDGIDRAEQRALARATGTARVLATTRLDRAGARAALADDLLYRVATIEIDLPPLVARGEDVLLLARHFAALAAGRHRKPPRPFSDEAERAIAADAWPDQVRGLRLAVERAVLLGTGDRIEPPDLALAIADEDPAPRAIADLNLERGERTLVEAALRRHGFNVSRAAAELGLTRAALYRRMAKHGL